MRNTFGTEVRIRFTLIELLVIVAIIAILAGMLLPTLAGAKKHGQRIACLSKHKQLGIAVFLYAANNNDAAVKQWPGDITLPNGDKGVVLWVHLLFLEVSGDKNTLEYWAANGNKSHPSWKMFMCDQTPTKEDMSTGWGKKGATFWEYYYGSNISIYTYGANKFTMREIVVPSDRLFAIDYGAAAGYVNHNYLTKSGMVGTNKQYIPGCGKSINGKKRYEAYGPDGALTAPYQKDWFTGRHGGRTPMTFLDGHAEARTGEAIGADTYMDLSNFKGPFRSRTIQ